MRVVLLHLCLIIQFKDTECARQTLVSPDKVSPDSVFKVAKIARLGSNNITWLQVEALVPDIYWSEHHACCGAC